VIEDERFFTEYPSVVAFLRAALDDECTSDGTRPAVLVVRFAGELHARYLPIIWPGSALAITFKTRFPVPARDVPALLDIVAEAWAFLEAHHARRTNATIQ
jgi:hypothetical protein